MAMNKQVAFRCVLIVLMAFLIAFDPTIRLVANGSAIAYAETLTPKRRDTNYRLHTDGKWIKDNQGNIVILRGANDFRRWMWPESWVNFDPLRYADENQEKYALYANTGANFLRVALNKWLWDKQNPTYTTAIDTLVSWCRERGIMIVFTFQGYDFFNYGNGTYGGWTKAQQVDYILNGTMREFMATLATRYKTQLNVIGFEIMPERPSDKFWSSYRGITRQQARAEYRNGLISAIQAIHSVQPDYLVFVYPANDDELSTFVTEAPISQPNVVYCEMRYVSWDKGWRAYADAYYAGAPNAPALMEQAYQSLLFNVMDLGYPVILMETGFTNDLPNITTYVNDIHTLFEKYQVGICWWTFDTPWANCVYVMLLQSQPGGGLSLTETGLAWAQDMKGWNLNPSS